MPLIYPGPWHWTYSPISNERIALVSADNKDVLLSTDDSNGNVYVMVSDENARLIGGAPDLLAQLEAAVAFFEGGMTEAGFSPFLAEDRELVASVERRLAPMRAAIAKAKGLK